MDLRSINEVLSFKVNRTLYKVKFPAKSWTDSDSVGVFSEVFFSFLIRQWNLSRGAPVNSNTGSPPNCQTYWCWLRKPENKLSTNSNGQDWRSLATLRVHGQSVVMLTKLFSSISLSSWITLKFNSLQLLCDWRGGNDSCYIFVENFSQNFKIKINIWKIPIRGRTITTEASAWSNVLTHSDSVAFVGCKKFLVRVPHGDNKCDARVILPSVGALYLTTEITQN